MKVIEKSQKDIAPTNINKDSKLYQNNVSKFYDTRPPSSSSTGSVFQRNAAHFLGCNEPEPGQKIVTKTDIAFKPDSKSKTYKPV